MLRGILFALAWLCASAHFGAARAAAFDNVFVFGDSLSDVGNAAIVSGGAYPPSSLYYEGRFSNGPLWIDHIAGVYGITLTPSRSQGGGNDYAFGGAETTADITIQGVPIPSIKSQISEYLAASGGKADPNALYVIWGGSNDALNANLSTAASLPLQFAKVTKHQVMRLASAGARSFLVPQVPDIGLAPAAIAAGEGTAASTLAKAMNEALALKLATLEGTGITIYRLHDYRLMDQIIVNDASAASQHFNFSNVTDACLSTGTPPTECSSPDRTFFWDSEHPSAFVHSMLAAAALVDLPH